MTKFRRSKPLRLARLVLHCKLFTYAPTPEERKGFDECVRGIAGWTCYKYAST